jgi:hypothetical protein
VGQTIVFCGLPACATGARVSHPEGEIAEQLEAPSDKQLTGDSEHPTAVSRFKETWSKNTTLLEIKEQSGRQVDPQIVGALTEPRRERRFRTKELPAFVGVAINEFSSCSHSHGRGFAAR